jgi:excinuclease ABC subunit A
MDVIKSADYIVDLGPEGGDKGGTIVAKGTPEEIAASPGSYTGQYLREVISEPRLTGEQEGNILSQHISRGVDR